MADDNRWLQSLQRGWGPEMLVATIPIAISLYDLLAGQFGDDTSLAIIVGYTAAALLIYLLLRVRGQVLLMLENTNQLQSLNKNIDSLEIESRSLTRSAKDIQSGIATFSAIATQNGEFIQQGFLGLQAKAIEIEELSRTPQSWRFASYGHLPSFIRSDTLKLDVAKRLYDGWTPEILIDGYVQLINNRHEAHQNYIAGGGQAYDFFSLPALERYSKSGTTNFDNVRDSREERLSRFKRLEHMNGLENCNLVFLTGPLGPDLLLRFEQQKNGTDATGGALLVDLRLRDTPTNFEESSYGVYSSAPDVIRAFRANVNAALESARKAQAEQDRQGDAKSANPVIISDKNEIKLLIATWIKNVEQQ